MGKSSHFLPAPPALNPDRLKQAAYSIRGACQSSGRVLVHYDPHQQCGAIFHYVPEFWTLWGPVTFDQFVSALAPRGIAIEDGSDLQAWVDACSAGMLPPPLSTTVN